MYTTNFLDFYFVNGKIIKLEQIFNENLTISIAKPIKSACRSALGVSTNYNHYNGYIRRDLFDTITKRNKSP